MKLIGFVGSIDKMDIIMYTAKMLSALRNKVIVIDATTLQKARYIIPTIGDMSEQNQYVVQFDSIDFAVGFSNMLELKKYFLSKGEDFAEYEYVLVDTDNSEMSEEYDLKSANFLFFVSSYDKFYLKKGIELLKYICAMKRRTYVDAQLPITKVLYYSELNTADTRLIDSLTEALPILWLHETINLPYDQGDVSAGIRNQYAGKIDVKFLNKMYKESICELVASITAEDKGNLRKVMKGIEKSASFIR